MFEELKSSSVAYILFIIFIMIFLWYSSANWVEVRSVADYYLVGAGMFLTLVGISAIFSEYIDVIIFKEWALPSYLLLPLGFVIAFAFISAPVQLIGLPGLGASPLNFAAIDTKTRIMRLVASVIETSVWSGVLFPTLVRLMLISIFFIPFRSMGSSYFLHPYSTIKEWRREHPIAFLIVLIPVVFLSAFLMGEIVARWHQNAYTVYCLQNNIPKDKCVVAFERVREFEIISDLLTYGTGSILPGVIVHFVNNLLSA